MVGNPHDDLLSMYMTYLDERGHQAVKIPETTTKTPDLEVSGHGNSYLNEFKSPDLLLDPSLGLYKFATTNSKLLQFIHTAIKQFKAHDPSHAKPWVITFASVNFSPVPAHRPRRRPHQPVISSSTLSLIREIVSLLTEALQFPSKRGHFDLAAQACPRSLIAAM